MVYENLRLIAADCVQLRLIAAIRGRKLEKSVISFAASCVQLRLIAADCG
ncbi:hypothetical protein IQ244_31485 [Nostoc sp. LEGE 06077]|nr:hypothetical protein [Nostoc sp. LEGE 06077]MBE9210945.1 hypothetical protein [Nostoc sp. LEGE 06077]